MTFRLPDLPYAKDALAPHLSAETFDFHHGKHHAAYVDKLNQLVPGTEWAESSLDDIIRKAKPGPLFNNAAQHWNHSFYWNCLSPKGGGEPAGKLADELRRAFGDLEGFKREFSEAALAVFGSGWTWLVRKPRGGLAIEKTPNADNPLMRGETALLTCDVWEHAYYIDYRNSRPNYLKAFWQVVNWEFAGTQL